MDANNGPIINLTWKGKNINLLKVILSILFFSVALALYAYKNGTILICGRGRFCSLEQAFSFILSGPHRSCIR